MLVKKTLRSFPCKYVFIFTFNAFKSWSVVCASVFFSSLKIAYRPPTHFSRLFFISISFACVTLFEHPLTVFTSKRVDIRRKQIAKYEISQINLHEHRVHFSTAALAYALLLCMAWKLDYGKIVIFFTQRQIYLLGWNNGNVCSCNAADCIIQFATAYNDELSRPVSRARSREHLQWCAKNKYIHKSQSQLLSIVEQIIENNVQHFIISIDQI